MKTFGKESKNAKFLLVLLYLFGWWQLKKSLVFFTDIDCKRDAGSDTPTLVSLVCSSFLPLLIAMYTNSTLQ